MAAFLTGIKNAVAPPPPQQQQQQQQPQQQQRPGQVPYGAPVAQPAAPMFGFPVAAIPMGQQQPRWTTRVGQCDPPATCEQWLCACFCTHCAQAQAKSNTDGTHVCYNCMCWHHGGSVSFIRREYGLFGTCGDDFMCSLFCAPCFVRQALTESELRGVVGSPFSARKGPTHREWVNSLFGCDGCECLEALFCPWCVAHYTRNMIQPVERGDCCYDMICIWPTAMYGQVRHHHGIHAEFGVFEDVCLPVVCYPCALAQARREAAFYYSAAFVQRAAQQVQQQFRGGQNGRGGCCGCC